MLCEHSQKHSYKILETLLSSDFVIIFLNEELKAFCFSNGAKQFFEGLPLEGKSLFEIFPSLNENTIWYFFNNNLVYQTVFNFRPSSDQDSFSLGRDKYLIFELLPYSSEEKKFALLIGYEITYCVETITVLENALKYDSLTSLLNLSTFLEEAQRILLTKPKCTGMLVLDLYNFSAVNDLYGLQAGNEILKEVAERLKKSFEGTVLISRTSADEFAIFIPYLEHRRTILQYIDYIKLIFEIPFTLDGQGFTLNYNVGVSLYPNDGTTSEALYRFAQAACSLAKKKGPNQVEYFNPQISAYLQEQLTAEKLIAEAFQSGWFTFFVQPYFDSKTSSLAGGETLVRIVKQNGEVIPPGMFIQALERSTYLEKFEKWAFQTVVNLINTFKIPLGLNFYPATFYNKKFFVERENLLQSLSRPIILEITERATIEDPQKAKEIINWLKRFPNVYIALDDFGTGYSNFSYLKELPIDVIKIDISFVRALSNDEPKTKQLVKTIIDLAHGLGAKALAEGVETLEQVEILTELECDYLQGFYFEKPLPIVEFEKKYLCEQKTKA